MITALIVDDQDVNISVLKKQLGKYFPAIELVGTATDPRDALALTRELKPDLVFLDIHMPGMNGFDFLRELEGTVRVEIIFVTAFSEFALEAFEHQVAGYITKPVNAEKLVLTVNAVVERILHKKTLSLLERPAEERKITLSTQKGLVFVDSETIYYCESSGNYTTFFLKDNRQILVSKQIGQFETVLPRPSFVRIHDRYIINLKHVKAYNRGSGGTVVLENDRELPVSVRRKEQLLKLFG